MFEDEELDYSGNSQDATPNQHQDSYQEPYQGQNQENYRNATNNINQSTYDRQYSGAYAQSRLRKESQGLAIASLILGILSLMFFLTGVNILTSILALVFGIIYLSTVKQKKGKGMAVAGIITAALAIVLCIGAWVFIIGNAANLASLAEDEEGMERWYEYYGLDEDDFYNDFYNDYWDENQDNYRMFENPNHDKSPFDNYDFDINDSL